MHEVTAFSAALAGYFPRTGRMNKTPNQFNLFAMKTSFNSLLLLAAFGAFATTSCSQETKEHAEATADSAANDAATNTQNAADATSNAVDNAAANVKDAAGEVKSDVAPEKGDTAVVVDKPAGKMVEETK